jgi:hypothetical protein
VIAGSVPFDSGVSVVFTDGSNVDWPVTLLYAIPSPPQLAFVVPASAAPGVALIAITNGYGTVSLCSAPLFAGAAPVAIAAIQGSGQSAAVNGAFSTPLLAAVKDPRGNPVAGAAVTFTLPATGASANANGSITVSTNSSGVAAAPGFTADAIPGSYTVTASTVGAGHYRNRADRRDPCCHDRVTPPSSGIAQNTWVEIQGSNLVPATTPAAGVDWSNAPDFAQGRMPTTLNGISVTIDGIPDYIYYFCSAATSSVCSQDQINVLSPLDTALGTV